ncbi:hypothetical protein [Candidatus Marinarcus aquaticus]|uniref:Thymidylate kinase-like domain-containing protein n=1 Tax=Candidatus Marinarcus aquaticus TaxID=2044504 RepID=A0A4Q0XPL0_9BACT|nr:hypothetical protein [Candidatus Marinarcus aquaticus]RXJ55314.1 hypothetical protein CRV04_10780 [Candidatus Marinarcus aquaticus]
MQSKELFELILDKANTKGLLARHLDDHTYFIDNENMNQFLKILFKTCTKNSHCMTLIKDEAYLTKINLFEQGFEVPLTYNVYTKMPEDITAEEKMLYSKQVEKLKKNRISPVIGPDGVGKTTLLQSSFTHMDEPIMYKRFKKIVRRSFIYNVMYPINKYKLKRKMGHRPQKDQHDDIHFFLVFLAGLFYYPFLMFNAKYRKKIVFVDRFFNDYLLENISFMQKKTVLRNNWRNLLRYIPQVYWNIHLDAKPKVILSRKDELSKRDIKRYRRFNFKIYLEKPSVVYTYINTGLDLEHCKRVLLYSGRIADVMKTQELSCQK